MTNITPLLISFLFILNSGLHDTSIKKDRIIMVDRILYTGWYYIVDTSDYKRQLEKTQEYYFIDPTSITTAKNFKQLQIHNNKDGKYEMIIQLDSSGTKEWSIATEKSIRKNLAFILDDKLLEADFVNSQITAGVTALIRGEYSKAELERLKTIIESEK